jgi:hypothetical protein
VVHIKFQKLFALIKDLKLLYLRDGIMKFQTYLGLKMNLVIVLLIQIFKLPMVLEMVLEILEVMLIEIIQRLMVLLLKL